VAGVGEGVILSDNGVMNDTAWMVDREVRCRCGQTGRITGVETGNSASGQPECIWVTHDVRGSMQAHIHRSPQMSVLLAQLTD
jgi:hypothetical protein